MSPGSERWNQGWHALARHLPSPNFGPRPQDAAVSLVVVHSISLPPGQYGGTQVHELFTNRLDWEVHPYFQQLRGLEVSAHFYIDRAGQLWQFVSCDDRAWHAGTSCFGGRDNCNDFSVGIELEGLDGDAFEPAQYEQLARLCRDLMQRYPIEAVTGHEHVAPGRKSDPGPGFDWQLLQQLTGWAGHCFVCEPQA